MLIAARNNAKIFPDEGESEHRQHKNEERDTLCQTEAAYPKWKRYCWVVFGVLTFGLAFLRYKRGSDSFIDAFADSFFLVPQKGDISQKLQEQQRYHNQHIIDQFNMQIEQLKHDEKQK